MRLGVRSARALHLPKVLIGIVGCGFVLLWYICPRGHFGWEGMISEMSSNTYDDVTHEFPLSFLRGSPSQRVN